jgi:hypothetical protein
MKDFHNFLHIMLEKPKEINAKEITLFYLIQCGFKVYLCKNNLHHNIRKNEKIFLKWLK